MDPALCLVRNDPTTRRKNMSNVDSIIKDAILKATPEALFDAYTNPEHLEKWFAVSATIDLSENGAWRYEFGGGLAAEGRVIEAVRPERFVWTWEKSITPDEQGVEHVYESDVLITYTFEAVDSGTRFTIEERNHASQEIRDMNVAGVEGMLKTLKAYVEDGVVLDATQTPQ
jgi:uncharacterized protein YndB with AHSA1/START domain